VENRVLKEEAENLRQRVHSVSVEKEELIQRHESLNIAVSEVTTQLRIMTRRYNKMKSKNEEYKKHFEKTLSVQLSKQQDTIRNYHHQLTGIKEKYDILYAQYMEKSKSLKDWQSKHDRLFTKHQRLETQHQRLSLDFDQFVDDDPNGSRSPSQRMRPSELVQRCKLMERRATAKEERLRRVARAIGRLYQNVQPLIEDDDDERRRRGLQGSEDEEDDDEDDGVEDSGIEDEWSWGSAAAARLRGNQQFLSVERRGNAPNRPNAQRLPLNGDGNRTPPNSFDEERGDRDRDGDGDGAVDRGDDRGGDRKEVISRRRPAVYHSVSSGQRADRSLRERIDSHFDDDDGSESEDEDEEELMADSNDDDDDEDDEEDGGGRDRALNDLHDLNGVSREEEVRRYRMARSRSIGRRDRELFGVHLTASNAKGSGRKEKERSISEISIDDDGIDERDDEELEEDINGNALTIDIENISFKDNGQRNEMAASSKGGGAGAHSKAMASPISNLSNLSANGNGSGLSSPAISKLSSTASASTAKKKRRRSWVMEGREGPILISGHSAPNPEAKSVKTEDDPTSKQSASPSTSALTAHSNAPSASTSSASSSSTTSMEVAPSPAPPPPPSYIVLQGNGARTNQTQSVNSKITEIHAR